MRILFITRKYPPSIGGMETYSKEIFSHLAKGPATVDLYKPRRDIIGRPTLPEIFLFFLGACWMLLRNARRYDCLLIGDYAIAMLAVAAKIATGGRIFTTVSLHGNDLHFMRRRSPAALIYRSLSWLVIRSRSINASIANSASIKQEAESHGLPAPTVVPLGTTVLSGTDVQGRRDTNILFAGRLIRYKGLSWFVREVWPKIHPHCQLLVAGPAWDLEELSSIEDQPRIRYLGALDPMDLRDLQSKVMVSIMPNIPPAKHEQDEGFGIVALESAAAGTPVVASCCGGLPDAVSEGVTGFLVSPLDAEAWAGRINSILEWPEEKRSSFATTASKYVEEHYSWSLAAKRTLEVLQRSRQQW